MAWLVHIVVAALLMSCSVKAEIGYCGLNDNNHKLNIHYCVRVRTSAWVWRTLIDDTSVELSDEGLKGNEGKFPGCVLGCGTSKEIKASLKLPGAEESFHYEIVRSAYSGHSSGYRRHPLEYRNSGVMAHYKHNDLEVSPLARESSPRDQQSKKTNTSCFRRNTVSEISASKSKKEPSKSKEEALKFETDRTLNSKQLTKRLNLGAWQGFAAEKEDRKAMVKNMGLCTTDTALTDKGNEKKPSYGLQDFVHFCVGEWTNSGWRTTFDGEYAADYDLFENEKVLGALSEYQHKIPHCNNGCALASEIITARTRYKLECEGTYTAIDHRAVKGDDGQTVTNPALIGLQKKELKKWKEKKLVWRMADADYSRGYFAASQDHGGASGCIHREAEGSDTDEMLHAVEERKQRENHEVWLAELNAAHEKDRKTAARNYASSNNASRKGQPKKKSAPRRRRRQKKVGGQSDDSGSDEEFDNDNGRSEG